VLNKKQEDHVMATLVSPGRVKKNKGKKNEVKVLDCKDIPTGWTPTTVCKGKPLSDLGSNWVHQRTLT
jgi:hypothetical protein